MMMKMMMFAVAMMFYSSNSSILDLPPLASGVFGLSALAKANQTVVIVDFQIANCKKKKLIFETRKIKTISNKAIGKKERFIVISIH